MDATTAGDVTVLADGAKWIGNLAEDVLPQAAEVLDFYHAAEHVADQVKAIWPVGDPASELYAGGRTWRRVGASGAVRWKGRSSSW